MSSSASGGVPPLQHSSSARSLSSTGAASPVPGLQAPPDAVHLELQIYPAFATVCGFQAEPRCVHPRQWTRDGDVVACVGCDEKFTFVIRKHHCRICGQIFCHACSSKKLLIQQKDSVQYDIRACDNCYADYQQPIVKTHRERIMGDQAIPLRGSSFRRFRDSELRAVMQFLTHVEILGCLGRVCRNLYFRCRENGVWQGLGLFKRYQVLGREGPAGSPRLVAAPAAEGQCDTGAGSQIQIHVSPSPGDAAAGRKPSVGSNAASPSGRLPSPSAGNGSGDVVVGVAPPRADGCERDKERPVITLTASEAAHPMSIYQAYTQFLEKRRRKRFKVLKKRLMDILSSKMKIAVVGAAGVGKSALVNSFVGGSPFPCGFETTGGRVRLKGYIPNPIGNCNSRFEPVASAMSLMELIDCGGAERYKALLPVYLSGAQCVLVCVNTRSPVTDQEYPFEQVLFQINKQITDCAPFCTADTIFIVCVLRLPPPDMDEAQPTAAAAAEGDRGEARKVSFSEHPTPAESPSRLAAAHPRIAAVTEANPFTAAGVKDTFRLCAQLVLDRDVVCYKTPTYSVPFVRERKASQTPLDILLGVR